jgi:cytochrome d ubiquinol oxidase subunit I
VVTGLESVPEDERPSRGAINTVHLAWDIMVGMGTALMGLALWFGVVWWRRRRTLTEQRWFLRAAVLAPIAAYMALESGWIVTEVGRQPWVVYEIMRTEEAVTDVDAGLVWASLTGIIVLYAALAAGTVLVIRGMTRRWREGGLDESAVPYGPREGPADP